MKNPSFWRGILRAASLAFLIEGFVSLAAAQSFNCYEGQGVLENNWNDWSWCTDDLKSTAYTDGGSNSIQVTYASGYQAFSLESSAAFSAGYFSALRFSINGGPTAGRSIALQLVVNGQATAAVNVNNYVSGGIVPAGAWATVTVPLSAFNLLPTDQISRFWLQDSTGGSQPSYWLDQIGWIPSAPSSATVNIYGNSAGKTLAPEMFGVNTAVWDNNLDSSACKSLIAKAAFKSFRFPGGSLSDGYHWATNTTDANTWQWATNFDQFADAISSVKGTAIITANYGTGTPAEAAAWVKYSNVTKNYGFKRWEVGNECYGSWEEDSHPSAHDPVTYANQFAQYYQQMKQVDPTISIGAVASPGEDDFANYSSEAVVNPRTGASHSGWTPVMLATMAKLNVKPDFLVYHRYPEYVNDCDFTLLTGNGGWKLDISALRQQLSDYMGTANAASVQLLATETNADAGTEGKQLCSLVNGLFLADSFGSAMQTECVGMLWWDLINGQNTSGDNGSWLYGWRMYGDEGVMSPDFSQTYPVFYIETLLNYFARPGDQVLSTDSTYGLLSCYATKRADGSVRLLVINKNPTVSMPTNVVANNVKTGTLAMTYTYGMAQDNAAKNGRSQDVAIAMMRVGATTSVTFPPYSATVIVFKGPTRIVNGA